MEKRRAHRIRVNLQARYRSSSVSLEGRVQDLSCDGLFLRSEYLDDNGEEVQVNLQLPEASAPIRLAGEVVRTDATPMSSGMGIRFHNVALQARLQLANYLLLQSSRTR